MKIAVPDLVSNSYFPAIAAVELGFFEREGLELSLEHIFPVNRCLDLLRDGELDFVAGAAHAVPQTFPDWQGGKLLAALAQHMYWLLVLRSDLEAVRGDFTAVRGLRIGAAPMVEQGLRSLLGQAGVDLERDDVQIMPVPGSSEPGASFGLQAAKALEQGLIDGFWANALGSECAVRSGAGTVLADVRRGDGFPRCRNFTFPALVTSDSLIQSRPEAVAAATRAIVGVQRALVNDVSLASRVGEKLFPPYEASLIAEVVSRDLPYYDAEIDRQVISDMQLQLAEVEPEFDDTAGYDQAVATQFSPAWYER